MAKLMNTEKDIQKKRHPTSLGIKEMQIKTAKQFHYTPIRMAKIGNVENNSCW